MNYSLGVVRFPMMLHNILIAVFTVFALATGCASAAKKPLSSRGGKTVTESTNVQQAQELEQRGKLLEAGLAYAHLASRATAPEKQNLQLHGADIFLRGNYTAQASQLLADTDTQGLEAITVERKQLLLAQLDLARGKRERALTTMNTLERTTTLDETRVAIYTFRTQLHLQNSALVDAARERMKLDMLLRDDDARRANQNLLLQNLLDAPEAALIRAKPPQADAFGGWIELALMSKSAQQQPGEITRLVSDWKARFPNHPAQSLVDDLFGYRKIERTELPQRIALLLPQQGSFAKAADAVRDGFLAAYYAQPEDGYRPAIQLYDSGNNPADITTAYQRAVREGAQFVIGPLDKNAVNVLAQSNQLAVPTLALNYTEQPDTPANFFQFGLAPEDEAAQTAERAWLDGFNRAVALVPEGSFGERLHKAFNDRWIELGGELLDTQTYSLKDNDLSPSIKKLLDIDQSEQRRTALRTVVGYDIKFSPRRRQDIDFVFVAAMPRHARLIRPQLNFHQANDLPVYATSHVFSGIVNARTDHDIDNVTFGDMPWVLPKARRNTLLNATIMQLWPQQAENYMRLYAFGIDAFNLISNLNTLAESRTLQHPGETGNLYLDDQRRIQRRLLWAEFKNGAPKLVE